MDTYYVKQGKRYIPVGYCNAPDIFDGIWLIQHSDQNRSGKNLMCRMDELPDYVEVKKLAKSVMLEEAIVEVLRDMNTEGKLSIYNISIQDMAEKISKEVYKKIKNNLKG